MKIDRSQMEHKLYGLPEQITEAKVIFDQADIRLDAKIERVMVAGMGGSAIAGDILRTVAMRDWDVPVEVVRSYHLPHSVDQHTLLIVASYSGNTEETLSAFHEGEGRNAKIFCISSGGELMERARQRSIQCVQIPKGLPPRCAVGYLTVPMLLAVHQFGLDLRQDIDETVAVLASLRDELSSKEGAAAKVARKLKGKLPVVYTSYEYGTVAFRWRTQLNENAKVWVHTNLFPELNHNEIVGLGTPAEISRRCFVVFLRDRNEFSQIRKRIELTKKIISPLVSGTEDVWSAGTSSLAKTFSLIYFGDWVSFHLAMELRVDPTPIERIDYLKSQLALGKRNENSTLR
ncbi:MAG: hypothetical protein AMJ46_06420 [Latescibacteria bacterium DG_63]|nr:MAG: hypothetical protein AMJ46_06420 [Latescibacteria bacterium DG_63]